LIEQKSHIDLISLFCTRLLLFSTKKYRFYMEPTGVVNVAAAGSDEPFAADLCGNCQKTVWL